MISLDPLALVGLILVAAWLAGCIAGRMVLARVSKLIDLMAEAPPEVSTVFIQGPPIERKKERMN